MRIGEAMLAEFEEEFAGTRKFLERVPDEKLEWKPDAKSMELRQLAWHLASFPEWCAETIANDVLKMSEEDNEKERQVMQGQKRQGMLEKFDRDLARARDALREVSDEAMRAHWKMEWGGQVVVDSPREQVLRKWVMNHMIHHRAQLGVYYRLNGIPVPGVYGPSADEMPA